MGRVWMVVIAMGVIGIPTVFTAGIIVALMVEVGANPGESIKTILGSVGDWVSGLGSVSAAIVAVYLADRQRRDNTAKVEISQYYNKDNFTIDLVSTGEKPAIVKGVFIRSPRRKKQIMLNRVPISGYETIVGRYEYGETKRLMIDSTVFLAVALDLEHELGNRKFDGLQLIVGTGTAEFRAELNHDFAQELLKEAVEA